MTALDIDFVRSQFPAFKEENLKGWAFFENAGGSYACAQVIDRLNRYYCETKVQPYATYPASARAGREMDQARDRLAGLLNVATDELSFGPSTSQNTYVLANALRDRLRPGDEIIVTNQDHEANSGVWRRLADAGATLREWRVDPQTGSLSLADLENLLSDKTVLVAMPHCSNIVAEINDVKAAADLVHKKGALLVVDGVSFAPHGLPDIAATGADIYLFSFYKTFGPHQGALYVNARAAGFLPNQGHYFNAKYPEKRFTPAGPDHAQISAINGVADYYEALFGHHFSSPASLADKARKVNSLMEVHEKALRARLLDFLASRNDVSIVGSATPENRAATIALKTNKPAGDLATDLVDHKVMTGAGNFYAVRLLEALGIAIDPGVLRLSFVHYTSKQEIDQLITALDQVL